jgi:hypothetical protein
MGLFRKKPPPLNRRDLLRSKPVRNTRLTWEQMDDGVVMLSIPRRNTWWIHLLSKIFYVPSKRTIVLDEIGSWVWTRCDGGHTVEYLISTLRGRYKLDQKEAEVSTLTYLKQLTEKGLIGFAITPSKKGEKGK